MENKHHNVRNQIVKLLDYKRSIKKPAFGRPQPLKVYDIIKDGVINTFAECAVVQAPTTAEDQTELKAFASLDAFAAANMKSAQLTFTIMRVQLDGWQRPDAPKKYVAPMVLVNNKGRLVFKGKGTSDVMVYIPENFKTAEWSFDGDLVLQFAKSTRCKEMEVTIIDDKWGIALFTVGDFKMLLAPLRPETDRK